ncbi:head-tail connector protein [Clostridium sp. UBA1652]|uniref:head-tail connector protein n=1 Tax=Clostridium sp. UBA1652 TaxID=1946348 RepID=UPI00257BB8F6|nr:head-tail connector protein [Clostridium sp. UBA1652]
MTLQEIKNYLKIDYDEEDIELMSFIEVSSIYIDEMVGEGYKTDEKGLKLADLLQKKLISDMYENRSTNTANNITRDRITESILARLSLFNEVV